jgi:hypothetical protein
LILLDFTLIVTVKVYALSPTNSTARITTPATLHLTKIVVVETNKNIIEKSVRGNFPYTDLFI